MKRFLFFLLFAACTNAGNKTECIDKSKIKTDAACIQIYKPVCGCDGKTYSNDCLAANSGLTSWTEGECKTDSLQKD